VLDGLHLASQVFNLLGPLSLVLAPDAAFRQYARDE